MKVVIVGGGAGGISTASNIRKLNKEIEITVITRDNKVAYSPCAIPYVLSGTIESFDDIVMRTPEDYKNKNIDVIVEAEVTAVDSDKKTVTYVKDGSEIVIEYDKLVLATGGNPFVPPMEGADLDGVFRIRNIEDGKRVKEAMKDAKSAIVTGAGLIGIEIAFALRKQGLDVILSEMLHQIVPRSLDKDMSDILVKYLEMEGIKVVLGKPITKLVGDGKVEKACFGDEDLYDADMVIMATGCGIKRFDFRIKHHFTIRYHCSTPVKNIGPYNMRQKIKIQPCTEFNGFQSGQTGIRCCRIHYKFCTAEQNQACSSKG